MVKSMGNKKEVKKLVKMIKGGPDLRSIQMLKQDPSLVERIKPDRELASWCVKGKKKKNE